jgi:hypothetical protein
MGAGAGELGYVRRGEREKARVYPGGVAPNKASESKDCVRYDGYSEFQQRENEKIRCAEKRVSRRLPSSDKLDVPGS